MIDPTITITHIEALMRTLDAELRATCTAGQWHATICSSGGAEYTGIGRSLLGALEDLFDVVARVVDGVPGEAA
jgi:hypothetical protein